MGTWWDLAIAVEIDCPDDCLHCVGHDIFSDERLGRVFDNELVNAEVESLLGKIGIPSPLFDHFGYLA